MNLEKEFALFERKMLLKYGLKPYELEKIELFSKNGKEINTIQLGNKLTTSAIVTRVLLTRHTKIITKRPGHSAFIDIDE